jgi:hypothetical protein
MATRPSRAPGRSDPGADGTSPLDGHDWPAEAADSIERVVQGVRDKTTGPAISAARWTVAGLFAAIMFPVLTESAPVSVRHACAAA